MSKGDSLGDFKDICKHIDVIATKLAKEIIKYEPLELIHRGFWSNVYQNIKGLNDQISDQDRELSGQILEFIQNYLVSLKPDKVKPNSLDDNGWNRIKTLLRDFNYHMVPFFILRSKYLQENLEKYDIERDALHTLDMMHWWVVRGNRYHKYQIIHVRELLLPQKKFFEEVFNYEIEEFLNDLEKIQHALTFGFHEAMQESISLYEETVKAAKEQPGFDNHLTLDQIQNAIKETGLRDKSMDAMERAFGLALCDVGKLTNFPTLLLEELSWKIGGDKDFWAGGMYAGWPLRVTPLRKRPLVKINNIYYCFDMNNFFDNLYRRIETIILQKIPEKKEAWKDIRKDTSENLALNYLASLLRKAEVFGPIYYGKIGFRKETDGIIIFDDVLVIVEVKSGPLDTGSPLLDFDKHQKKLVELIENPATQAKNFREYLTTNKEIKIYDGNSKKSLVQKKLKLDSFRKIYQCTISIENITHLTSRARKLSPLGVQVHTSANWSISLDDLRVYGELFESSLQFLHFLEQRELAEQSELVELNDELDHLGLYLQKNNYARYADELIEGKNSVRVLWDSFTQEIDDYFTNIFLDKGGVHTKPNQEMPIILREIIIILEKQEKPGRARVSSFLLDGASDYRNTIEDAIKQSLQRQKKVNRPNPFFISGEMSVCAFCVQNEIKVPNEDWRKDYARYRLLISGKDDALILVIHFDRKNIIINVDFDFVSIAKILFMELERIRIRGEQMKISMTTYHFPTSK